MQCIVRLCYQKKNSICSLIDTLFLSFFCGRSKQYKIQRLPAYKFSLKFVIIGVSLKSNSHNCKEGKKMANQMYIQIVLIIFMVKTVIMTQNNVDYNAVDEKNCRTVRGKKRFIRKKRL